MIVMGEKLQIRILQLRQMLDECPSYRGDNGEIKQILETAPHLLAVAEDALHSGDPMVLKQTDEVLKRAEIDIEWAVGISKGDETAQRIRDGREAHPDLTARERLLDRLLKFIITIIGKDQYMELIQEFGGEVDGDSVYMDPGEETEAFSQWILNDKIVPGQSNVLIHLFAQKEMDRLPPDEQVLLKGYLKNWPSVFEIIEINKKKNIYTATDLLSGKKLKFRDKSTAKTLKKNSIFIGRAIPFNIGENLYYPLGKILELPQKLWEILSHDINEWAKSYYRDHPGSSSQDFFRFINAPLRRKILEVTNKKDCSHNNKTEHLIIDPHKEKIAKEIDSFIKHFKKKNNDINKLFGHPELLSVMNKFKSIMDASHPEEMGLLCSRYDGFYEFAKFLENFASAVHDGAFNDL